MRSDIEKPGAFYLGKIVDPVTEKITDSILQYESKNLTTHAICVGMTGSGKTGLGITFLEEAALESVPAIIIDPKGDLTNLLLTFPNLAAEDFLPWIDIQEAEKKGESKKQYAELIATTWKNGLSSSFEDGKRIQKLKESVEMQIYTPASNAGIPISILSSFSAPSAILKEDQEFMRDSILSLTSSLLGLLGINADPIKSREAILISALIDRAWQNEKNLDIATLIKEIQNPGFDQLGALDIETFFPQKDRIALSISLNALLASKSFLAWTEGEPLDIDRLLYTNGNKPKFAIFSIAHLSDSERMFFVTLLLNQFLTWMRRLPGSSSLKAILYMDEIFGFFPPTATPPSKLPMLSLLKTARAFGVGVFLSTQNPADLDYKGLANCGTWLIGKLQTERDKNRILEGLRAASNGELNTATLDKLISSIKKRTFIMRSIYEKEPIIFETRWTMSYLKGPLTLPQIKELTKNQDSTHYIKFEETKKSEIRPILPPGFLEYFINPEDGLKTIYKPFILTHAKLHFVDAKNKVDTWVNESFLLPIDLLTKAIAISQTKKVSNIEERLEKEPVSGSTFQDLPAGLLQEKSLIAFQKAFISSLYQNEALELFYLPELQLISKPGESREEFSKKCESLLKENLEEALKKLENKYSEKRSLLNQRLKRADDKASFQKHQSFLQKIEAFISFLSTCVQAFLGKRLTKGTISQMGTSMRRVGRVTKENQQTVMAEEAVKSNEDAITELQIAEKDEELKLKESVDESLKKIEQIYIKAKKSDIIIENVALVWN